MIDMGIEEIKKKKIVTLKARLKTLTSVTQVIFSELVSEARQWKNNFVLMARLFKWNVHWLIVTIN